MNEKKKVKENWQADTSYFRRIGIYEAQREI
jgi:hypothetical protein